MLTNEEFRKLRLLLAYACDEGAITHSGHKALQWTLGCMHTGRSAAWPDAAADRGDETPRSSERTLKPAGVAADL